MVSQTRVLPTTRWPQPPGTPAGGQSSPPGIPPWKRSYGVTKDLVSLSQPPDTLEAAKVDGAGALATFRELTLPHLRPYIELGILLGSIYLVNTFDAVRLMTNGGPGTATTNLPFFLYQQVNFAFDVGGAAATGVVTVILTIIVATFALRMFARVFQFEGASR